MKLRWKILIPVVALILTLVAVFVFLVLEKTGSQISTQQEGKAVTLLRLFRQIVVDEENNLIPKKLIDSIQASIPQENSDLSYVIVYGLHGEGATSFGSRLPRGVVENIEWNDPLDAPPLRRVCPDADLSDITEYIAPLVSYTRPQKMIGIIKMGISMAPVQGQKQQLLMTIGFLGALLLVIAIILANYLAKSVTQPIDAITTGIEAMGRGELSYRIEISSADELGALGASFNQMADRLRVSRAKIENYSRDLEEMVRARTGELRRAYDELKRLDELKDTFLSSVSHELRTPLTSIHSFAEILLQYADEDPATRKEFLSIIKRETERLSRLIDDVLDLAKIEAGMASWKVDRHDLRKTIDEAVAALRPLLEGSRISIHTSYPPRLPEILGDKDRLSQVITNLLSNARKFTTPGDVIDVRVSVENGYIRTEIQDHGIGIAKENLEKIFEKFRQVDNEHMTNKVKGTGLGLPISRDIIEFHGGKLWAESDSGKGSTFIFTIPTADNPESRPISEHVASSV